VLAVDVNGVGLAELKGEHCRTLAADLTDPAVRAKVADWAEGGDYLVNSAGIVMIKPIFELTVEDWRRVQTINAEATFFLCQKIGPRLRPGGAIVNLSSSSAKLATTIEVAAYAASKDHDPLDHALLRLCPRLASGAGQRDSAGHCRYAHARGGAGDRGADARRHRRRMAAARNKLVPLGRGAAPDECAALIWFLLSDESAYMTGQAINFTGGLVNW